MMESQTTLAATGCGATTVGSPPQILVVDDNRDAAQTLSRLLNALGMTANATFSGQAALDEIEQATPALVFLDLGMPGMDGVETAKRIRASAVGEKIQLVALTGLGREEDLARTRDAGFAAHLVKPVNLAQLEQTLVKFVGYDPARTARSPK